MPGTNNTIHPWFRFERQPLLFQNMLFKTDSVKAEPVPHPLSQNSPTFQKQFSLLGFIRSFDQELFKKIEAGKPVERFWSLYEDYYTRFDGRSYFQFVLSKLASFFDWEPHECLSKISKHNRDRIANEYATECSEILKFYEIQKGPWYRYGLSSQHKRIIFKRIAKRHGEEVYFGQHESWALPPTSFFKDQKVNFRRDISQRPQNQEMLRAIKSLQEKFPKLIRHFPIQSSLIGSNMFPVPRDILVVSRNGLTDAESEILHNEIKEEFSARFVGIIRPQNLKHMILRIRHEIVHLNSDIEPPQVQRMSSRSSSGTRVEPMIFLSDKESERFATYIKNVVSNFESTLGPCVNDEIRDAVKDWETWICT